MVALPEPDLYFKVLQWVIRRRPLGWGFERVTKILERMGNLHHRLTVIHVAGTNGKGSCATKIAAGLKLAFLQEASNSNNDAGRVGLFTSPHLFTARERIAVDNVAIQEQDFALSVAAALKAALAVNEAQNLSCFEITTIAAFHYFYYGPPSNKAIPYCRVCVLETGLGGRDDATNVCPHPLYTVITSVSRDHERLLGNTYESIATEKSHIAKAGVPLLVGPRINGVAATIMQVALSRKAAHVEFLESIVGEDFEAENCRVALAVLSRVLPLLIPTSLPIAWAALKQCVFATTPPCRFQVISPRELKLGREEFHTAHARFRGVILDVGHNEDAFGRLGERLKQLNANLAISVSLSRGRPLGITRGLFQMLNESSLPGYAVSYVDATHSRLVRRNEIINARDARETDSPKITLRNLDTINDMEMAKSNDAYVIHVLNETNYPSFADQMNALLEYSNTHNAWLIVCGTFFVMREVTDFLGLNPPVKMHPLEAAAQEQVVANQQVLVSAGRAAVDTELALIFGDLIA